MSGEFGAGSAWGDNGTGELMAGTKIGLGRRIFPRTLLRWTEPRAFQRNRNASEKRGTRKLLSVIVVASALFIGVMGALEPGIVPRLVGALAAILAWIGFIVWAYRKFPYVVVITDTYIVHDIKVDEAVPVYFKDIDYCEIAGTTVDGRDCPVLIVVQKRGDRETLGVAPAVSLAELSQVLESRGVRVISSRSPAA